MSYLNISDFFCYPSSSTSLTQQDNPYTEGDRDSEGVQAGDGDRTYTQIQPLTGSVDPLAHQANAAHALYMATPPLSPQYVGQNSQYNPSLYPVTGIMGNDLNFDDPLLDIGGDFADWDVNLLATPYDFSS